MSETGDTRAGAGPPERAAALWELWQRGERPDVREFVALAGELEAAELAAVLGMDQLCRWEAGERVPAEDYLDRYPRLADDAEAALELIYGEYLLRQQRGEAPREEDFLARFPRFAERLRQQLELNR